MRFFLDNDVTHAVARVLREKNHEVWTASEAGLSGESDDSLTVYANDKRAALLTHDREFSVRRRANTVGQHVWIDCPDYLAADLVKRRLDDLTRLLQAFPDDVFVHVQQSGVRMSCNWR